MKSLPFFIPVLFEIPIYIWYSSPVDEADSKKLDRILALAEENNEYIKKVRSTQKNTQMFKAIYWVAIITFAVGGFYFLKPYFNTLNNLYSSISGEKKEGTSLFQIPEARNIQGIIDQITQQQQN